MTKKLYYVPGDSSTLDYPVRPLWWFVCGHHPRRWLAIGTLIAWCVLLIFGVLPAWTWWPYQVVVWSFNAWQVMGFFYDRADHKREALKAQRRHEARMAFYDRESKKHEALMKLHSASRQQSLAQWHADMERFRQELSS